MGITHDIKDSITTTSKKLYKTGKKAADIAAINSKKRSLENQIKNLYTAIGQMYYEMYALNNPNPEFNKEMAEIASAKSAIKDLDLEAAEIKNEQ